MRYLPVVDAARILAAALVVWYHTPGAPGTEYALAGLAYFLVLTFTLQAISEPEGRSFVLVKRARRLLVPWLFWCLVYLGFGGVRQLFFRSLGETLNPLLYGPRIHLWFLPFVFLGGLASTLLLRCLSRLPTAAPWLLLGLASVVVAVVGYWHPAWPWPYEQWLYSVPLLCAGLSLGLSRRAGPHWRSLGMAGFVGFAVAASWSLGLPSYILGMLALAAAIPWKSREIVPLQWLAGLSMGIYLSHPAILYLMERFGPQLPWYGLTLAGVLGSAGVSVVILLIPGLGLIAFGQQWPLKRTQRPAEPTVTPTGPTALPG